MLPAARFLEGACPTCPTCAPHALPPPCPAPNPAPHTHTPPPSPRRQAKAKREALAELASGSRRLVVGTHSLLFVPEYKRLGLVVVDEQHK